MGDRIPGYFHNLTRSARSQNPDPARQAGPQEISARLTRLSRMPVADVLTELATGAGGIGEEEAAARLERYGKNEIATEKPPRWYVQLLSAFLNPFNGVLLVLAIVSLFTDVILSAPEEQNWQSVAVISVMVLISVFIRFWQEYRSGREAEGLRAMVRTTGTVYRADAGRKEVPISELVPGDILHISAGDMVPGDVRLLSAKDLFLAQSALTGESMPVEKTADLPAADAPGQKSALDLSNICFMGTSVLSGTAQAVVVSTGSATYFGSFAKKLVGKHAETSFEKGINKVSWLLIRFIAVMVPVIFFLNGFTKGDWLQAFLFGLAVAVGLIPEMLPMIVTTNLAKGAAGMAKSKTVVKRLNAIQNLGAMDVLCTDKTGTLTQDRIILVRHLGIDGKENPRVLKYAYLNSYYQTGLKNLLDVAVLEHEDVPGFNHVEQRYHKIDEIPFDFQRRRMSVVLDHDDGRHLMITKGAVEEILSVSSFVEQNGVIVPMTGAHRDEVTKTVAGLNDEGLRVLAVAIRALPTTEAGYSVADEKDLVLAGYIGFLDPPKETAGPAIAALKKHGITVKILTGDNALVTRRVCEHVGIDPEPVIDGYELDALSDKELVPIVERTSIFTKMSPLQKSRVIKVLQQQGHTVGFLGDGINDAAALRDADVGISVDTATDIAKESADIILLEKSLMVLEEGVLKGRETFANIMKYIKMAASSNFGNMFSVVVASAFLPFLPMLAIQLLVQNLLYDISQLSIPWDRVDEEYLRVPRMWQASDLGRFMVCIGPISSIFDIATFAILWFIIGANTVGAQALFQSGWFVEGLLTQTLIVHMIRTRHVPFVQSRASWPVLALTATVMAVGIAIPFTALGSALGFVPLPAIYFPFLIATLVSYCVLTQIVKTWYIRRYGTWL
ncbi:magnesium-translocating P-type ATPase [Methanoregula sp. UBA64]|jgi:P-type Mg2+ transporter|uniref:magnesium-translocating P-type ATPase n=1 Tax=Methanoregula sp. UBA64 TaxID=1915554 RepID=UPI0025D37113|nr:magnesium-translocating P-type ATPase [Methanoregula sp. UBA64]